MHKTHLYHVTYMIYLYLYIIKYITLWYITIWYYVWWSIYIYLYVLLINIIYTWRGIELISTSDGYRFPPKVVEFRAPIFINFCYIQYRYHIHIYIIYYLVWHCIIPTSVQAAGGQTLFRMEHMYCSSTRLINVIFHFLNFVFQ